MRGHITSRGRIIRRYRKEIPAEDFEKWQDLICSKAKGHGLYALYKGKRLIYVGLATKSIRSRIRNHKKKIPFSHFSVFLVSGSSPVALEKRIRDLEALLLNILMQKPSWNKNGTGFVGAKKLKLSRTR